MERKASRRRAGRPAAGTAAAGIGHDAEAKRRQAEEEALLEAGRAVLKYRQFEDAARIIFDRCKALIGAAAGYIALLSPEGDENQLLFLDAGGIPCSVDPALPMPIRGLRADVYRTGQAAYENDFAGSKWAKLMPAGHATLDNVLFAPLTGEGQVLGLLGLANKAGGFTEDDARLATAFGELAAVALANSRTLEALQISEHRFHSLVETASDAIICANRSGEIVLWNRSAEGMFGYSSTEAVGQPVTLIMPERFHDAHRRGMKRFLGTGKPRIIGHTVEMSGRRRDGAEFPVELSLATWKSKEEAFFAGIIRDISEHKQADQALRASEQRYRLLAENATDAIYRYRLVPSPGYEYMSPGMTSIVGYTPEDFYEDADIDNKIVHADDRALLDEMRKTPASFVGPVMLRCIRNDGSIVWIEHHQTAITDDKGRTVAIEAIARDVSERVRTMDELEKLRNEFLGMVTHELKTPLAAIKGSAATALGSSRPLDPEDTRELFQIIDEQSDRLRDLADNLLDMTRIEAGALAVKPEPVDLRSVLEEARTIFARGGRSQEVQIDLSEEMAVNADKRRLVQVITNLLTNAAKFSPASRPIRMSAERDPLHATVHVEDQGQGIRQDKLPLLFQKFSQVHDGSKTRTLGTGLGLAICKGIVEAHGGRIWADSAGEGKGSTFSFTLPVASEPVATSSTAKPQAAAAVRRGERLRILAVDDELPVLRYLQHSLDEAGYQCLVTTDPSQVTKFVELEQPDLILLDLRLPGVSGFDLLKRIREFSAAPIIFLTASDSSEDTVRALKMGADDYVTKPFSPSELLARIEASLRRRSLPGMTEPRPPFKLKDLTLNFAERRVILGDEEISLSATEYKLLYELATHAGLVLTFDQILQRVWGAEYAGETELVRSFIRNLRRKLGDDAKQPSYILTERQIGYRMLKE